ncbi:cation:proton antiporter [Paracoccus sediminis]|uniref:Cation:proton antiporter n=1 Tax=Paracoccus sediminis TaxID=1214787 RepID=A0A238Y2N4_9RHOB|nr:monovalent cation/H(+) antiporter subunit G [Paracoccus sediminis]TBN47232.1 cation:proton antiporter [Paracoccus sediminis]SNR65546.1 multisubunit potassium/proton antiporter, PhaG subunit [Paracoccus sediminis]
MTPLQAIPLAVAIPVAILVVLGSTLTLIGALGLARLATFYDRLHAPTLATSWGTGGIIIASALMFSFIDGRPVVHEFVIGFCIVLTTPVTLMMLGRAALQRDRAEGRDPFRDGPSGDADGNPSAGS